MRIRNLFARQRARNGFAATIGRGNLSCPATVRQGHNANQADTNGDFAVEGDGQDICMAAADYRPTGQVSLPQLDDRIAFTNQAGVPVVLRVIIPASSDQCFQSCDIEQSELRVHCKTF